MMRASISTCRCGMSMRSINNATCANLSATSVTNSWLVRTSTKAEPRPLSKRGAGLLLTTPLLLSKGTSRSCALA